MVKLILQSFHYVKITLFVLAFLDCTLATDSNPDEDISFSKVWEAFWTISCEFSDLVTQRSKRSVAIEPNFEDPEELFNYLYPLADVTVEEYMASEGRSVDSLSAWMDDLVDLWRWECRSRTPGNERGKRDADDPGFAFDEEGQNQGGDYVAEPYEFDSETTDILKNVTESPITSSSTPAAAEKKEKKVIPDADTFFTQYGGDIEYFFPLISFGIPFDGEITFLGFHGFKGLFPYK